MNQQFIYIVRHALVEYTGNSSKDRVISLSTLGGQQALDLASKLLSIPTPVEAIYSSDLPRAIETIRPFAESKNMTIHQDSGFAEHNYAGNTKKFHEESIQNRNFKFPGGESLEQSSRRFSDAIEKVVLTGAHTIIVSTHGSIFADFLIRRFNVDMNFYFQISCPDVYVLKYEDDLLKEYRRCSELLPFSTTIPIHS
ncbi:MAG: histidine phosphatase family protein [Candidatus Taylorbacteria bacterium]|nr:histidine phosphatase family protein [Candidatus Taylorbacteria bacterium]